MTPGLPATLTGPRFSRFLRRRGWWFYRSTQFGLQTEAVSESERAAAAVGVSPNRVAVINWALGSGIAAVAGMLVVPIITLQVTAMTGLVLAALAAALVGDFRSFPIATAAGFALGVGQAVVGRFADQQGLGDSLPFLVTIVMMVVRGHSLPLRDHFLQKLPMVGNGRMSWDWTLCLSGAVVFIMLTKQTKWIDAFTVSLGVGIVLLSLVALIGYAGQLSLAQYTIAGFGAYVAGRLVAVFDIPFLLGLVAGVAAAVPLGLLFALPAGRTRGINLSIVTLGLGSTSRQVHPAHQRHRHPADRAGQARRGRHRVGEDLPVPEAGEEVGPAVLQSDIGGQVHGVAEIGGDDGRVGPHRLGWAVGDHPPEGRSPSG